MEPKALEWEQLMAMVSCCDQTCVVAGAARLFHPNVMVQGIEESRRVRESVCFRWPLPLRPVLLYGHRKLGLSVNLAHPCQERLPQEVVT